MACKAMSHLELSEQIFKEAGGALQAPPASFHQNNSLQKKERQKKSSLVFSLASRI
jgi:hypothetical protein